MIRKYSWMKNTNQVLEQEMWICQSALPIIIRPVLALSLVVVVNKRVLERGKTCIPGIGSFEFLQGIDGAHVDPNRIVLL